MPYSKIENFFGYWAMPLGIGWFIGLGTLLFLVLVVWSIYWKGRALWKAARNEDKAWFVVLLIVNTVGILEILYIYFFSKRKTSPLDNQ